METCKSAYIAIVLGICLLWAGCSDAKQEWVPAEEPVTVKLRIDVALADIAETAPRTRAPEDAANAEKADGPNEKMQTLRLVVVRPDGTVEANEFIELATAVTEHGYDPIEVVGNETKRVYLFVHERATGPEDGGDRRLVTEELDRIAVGRPFPESRLYGATIQLNGDDRELAGTPLPMSDRHTVEVPDHDLAVSLFVTRAAVKFSFLLRNETGRTLTLDRLTIDKMARKEYYLPRVTRYGDKDEILDYIVPSVENNEYYTFRKELARALKSKEEVKLPAIYLLEGKYRDAGDSRNYRMSLSLNGMVFDRYFDNLSQLPRNTHVVVTVRIKDTEVIWEADVVPYGDKALFPIFGLDG